MRRLKVNSCPIYDKNPRRRVPVQRHVSSSLRPVLWSALWLAFAVSACAGPDIVLTPGDRLDLVTNGPEPGELEDRARTHLDTLTELVLTIDESDPHETVMTIGRYLDAHSTDITDAVQQLDARVAAMTDEERLYYEERFSDYFGPATHRWREALNAYRELYPTEAQLIDGLMGRFD